MYEEYFRLTDAPFRLSPDPRFFYGSRSHNKAMAYLHYGLKQAEGFIVITGPVGAGKSMIIGHLLDQLNTSNVVAANLLPSNVEPKDLLSQVLSAFRIEPEGEGRTGEIEAFEDYLFDQLNRGRRVLLIIDEAQNLPFKTLEELRMLSNIDYEGTPLFQVFLVGQPEFRAMIESDRLEQLRQRVIASYHLESLSLEETRDYILHRLSVAGWEDDPAFTDDAFKIIFEESTGLPRRINTICNRVMLYCSLEQAHEVTDGIVKTVCDELKEEKLSAKKAADAVPPVTKIDEEETPQIEEAATAEELNLVKNRTKPAGAESAKDEVVVSIDSARTQNGAAGATKNKERGDETEKQSALTPDMGQVMSSSMSVLDRLRAKKASAEDEERHEATLKDVATAIAAASGENSQDREAAVDTGVEQTADVLKAAETADMPQWREALLKSVDQTREELKEANANVVRLRRASVEASEKRAENRRKAAENLSRAEALLQELRKAQD